MNPLRQPLRTSLILATTALALTACLPGDDPVPTGSNLATGLATTAAPGGTLTAVAAGQVTTWDPQRMGSKADATFAARTFQRTLTAYAPSTSVDRQGDLVPDLATDTGKASKDLKTWTFALRDGVTWQDGSKLTCKDVKYGISRTFATTEISGGPGYAIAMLDIPKTPKGASTYRGPYDTSAAAKAGAAAFDKAVTCKGQTITFRLAAPKSDFNEALTLPAFAPVNKAHDTKAAGTFEVFSSGPYQLQGAWSPGTGGTFVRNPAWQAATDPIRSAFPDKIVYKENQPAQNVVQQIHSGDGGGDRAVSVTSEPPALHEQILGSDDLKGRTVNPDTGLIDYLAPNVKGTVFRTAAARQALALATDRAAYVQALGGASVAIPARSLIPASIAVPIGAGPSATSSRATSGSPTPAPNASSAAPTAKGPATKASGTAATAPTTSTVSVTTPPPTAMTASGTSTTTGGSDAQKAAALLAQAELTAPVKITVAYRQSESMDKALAALVPGWQRAGFAPVLKPMDADYFTKIADPKTTGIDVYWANWAPEWASASTILAPIFDSRINLIAGSKGRDYGSFQDPSLNKAMDALASVADRTTREAGWAGADQRLQRAGAYVGLAERRAVYIAGDKVQGFSADNVTGGYVEFATIGVAK
ncbi:MAG: ABC transporter substrate-binding protein [Nostocoides sp.]